MNAQSKIAGQSPDPAPQRPVVEAAPDLESRSASAVAFDDDSRIEDWVEEGGASR